MDIVDLVVIDLSVCFSIDIVLQLQLTGGETLVYTGKTVLKNLLKTSPVAMTLSSFWITMTWLNEELQRHWSRRSNMLAGHATELIGSLCESWQGSFLLH